MTDENSAPEAAPEPVVDPHVAALSALPGVKSVSRPLGEWVIEAERAASPALFLTLRDGFAFEQVMDVCGVDYLDREERFEVVYNLLSVSKNQRLRVIIRTDAQTPVASVTGVWPSAGWWERETYDLFGIRFEGLADHRRILTDYGFEGHPLRKDFPLTGFVEVHYDEARKEVVYDKVQLAQEFRNFDFLSPWEGMTTLPGDEKARGGAK